MPTVGSCLPSCYAVRRRCAARLRCRTRGTAASNGVLMTAGLPLRFIVGAPFTLSVRWSYGLP
jgi:hypothetical protein